MDELDARYKKKLSKASSCTPPKPRKVGTISTTKPPLPLLGWAVDQEWLKGNPIIDDGLFINFYDSSI